MPITSATGWMRLSWGEAVSKGAGSAGDVKHRAQARSYTLAWTFGEAVGARLRAMP